MWVWVHVCECVFSSMHVYMCSHPGMCVFSPMRECVNAWQHVCVCSNPRMCVCTHMCSHPCVCVCSHLCVSAWEHVCVFSPVCVCALTHACVCECIVCALTHEYVHVHECACARVPVEVRGWRHSWRHMSSSLTLHFSFWGRVSVNLELADSAGLAHEGAHRVWSVHLPPPGLRL